ncbi:poly-beta-1,6-N-acetyl-D-glucosamine N-deacetylase PgaB [Acinetobacter junii]|uniref:poly-beta-1,6-N-acetyl-D-glucosamine N-deacetylase PgaB n=1 Tax=Acinetobacter junii TaxID=40215 RepID=UPI001BA69179|nr:poly-beta-1,6-N-acetyl-D-glucosamine N-deacetylase PgaB [Acinetobacter junii]QUS50814.1 poly-beta-1,6-N-acetyl-D-glucosamine N-deacetylase PgaB [Acinetobacter junii]
MNIKSPFCLLACISAMSFNLFAQPIDKAVSESAQTSSNANQFVTLTFHDVRDDVAAKGDRDYYAISSQNFAQFLQWIKDNKWQPIRLEDVWQARNAGKALPERALLLTVDDGVSSAYTHIFPLLKLHKIPAVFAIPTSWINGNTKDAIEAYGTSNLMTWQQMREMQASGLVEFGSHSDNLHYGIAANPQKNLEFAAITRQYFPQSESYETDEAFRRRVLKDLQQSKQILDKELGTNTRAIFWPYGAVTKETEELASMVGLPLSFSLGSELNTADLFGTYQRALIIDNPIPAQIYAEMQNFVLDRHAPYKQRKSFLRFNLAELVKDNGNSEQRLGQLLDQVGAFKSNNLLLTVVEDQNDDGKIDVAYFPNRSLPMKADLLNRVVWQARTRIANKVYAELPLSLETQQGYDLSELIADLVKNNSSITGLMIETDNTLHCAIIQRDWDHICQKKINDVLAIKNKTKLKANYYVNVSTNYQTALKFSYKGAQWGGLQKLLQLIPDHADFLYIALDSNQSKNNINELDKVLSTLTEREKQHLIISLQINNQASSYDWKKYQQIYQQLKRQGVQKIGVDNYQLSYGATIHQYLYRELSLNGSPLSYRNPYVLKQGGR